MAQGRLRRLVTRGRLRWAGSWPGQKLRIRTLVALCVMSGSAGTAIGLVSEVSWGFGLLATEVGLVSVMFASGALAGKWLKEDGKPPFPVCLNCGYDLRGLDGGVCPECGESIVPRV